MAYGREYGRGPRERQDGGDYRREERGRRTRGRGRSGGADYGWGVPIRGMYDYSLDYGSMGGPETDSESIPGFDTGRDDWTGPRPRYEREHWAAAEPAGELRYSDEPRRRSARARGWPGAGRGARAEWPGQTDRRRYREGAPGPSGPGWGGQDENALEAARRRARDLGLFRYDGEYGGHGRSYRGAAARDYGSEAQAGRAPRDYRDYRDYRDFARYDREFGRDEAYPRDRRGPGMAGGYGAGPFSPGETAGPFSPGEEAGRGRRRGGAGRGRAEPYDPRRDDAFLESRGPRGRWGPYGGRVAPGDR